MGLWSARGSSLTGIGGEVEKKGYSLSFESENLSVRNIAVKLGLREIGAGCAERASITEVWS